MHREDAQASFLSRNAIYISMLYIGFKSLFGTLIQNAYLVFWIQIVTWREWLIKVIYIEAFVAFLSKGKYTEAHGT